MSILDDFLPAAKDPATLSLEPADNHSDLGIGEIMSASNASYPVPTQSMQGSEQSFNPGDFFNKPSSLSTQLGNKTFNWERSGADRYVGNKHYPTTGFDPFAPAVTVDGKAYDANELKYGALQTWGDVAKNSLAGMGSLAWTAAGNNVKSWGNTVNALYQFASSGDFQKTKEAFIGTPEELLKANQDMEATMNKYAIYHTPEGDNGFFNKEFIGSSVQQLGFTVGTAAEMLAEMWLTAGIAEAFAPMRAASGLVREGRALQELGQATKLAENARSTASTAKTINGIRETLNNGWDRTLINSLYEGAKKFVPFGGVAGDLRAASRAGATASHLASIGTAGIMRTLSSFNAAKAESIMESANTYGQLYGDLLNQYQDSHDAKMPEGDELQAIKDAANHAATDNFVVNTGLLTVMNELEFGNFMNKFSSSKRLMREALESGEKNVFSVSGTLKGTEKVATRAYEKGRFGLFSDFNKVRNDFGIGTALWDIAKKFPKTQAAKFELMEGLQEILQNTSDQTFRNYYTNLYNGGKDLNGNSILGDIAHADYSKGWESQMNKEGFKTFLMGAVTGMFLSPLTGITGKARDVVQSKTNKNYRDAKEAAKAERTNNVNTLNAFYTDPNIFLNSAREGVKIQGKIAQNQKEALENSDQYAFINSKDDALAKAAAVAIKTGNYDSFVGSIRDIGTKMTDEEFSEAFGIPATNENRINAKAFTDNVIKEIGQYHENWQNLKDKFSDLVRPELFLNDPKMYSQSLIAKRALDESIEILATTSSQGAAAMKRIVDIKNDLTNIPGIGNSAVRASDILGNQIYTAREIQTLKESIASYEGLPGKDIAEQRANKEQQLKYLQSWYDGHRAHEAMKQSPEDEYNQPGYTEFFTENREKMMESYKGYIRALNNEGGLTTIHINDQDMEKAYKSTVDSIALNRDAGHYVEALNILTNPQNFVKLFGKISDAINYAKVSLYLDHEKEIKEKTPLAEDVTPEVAPTPGPVTDTTQPAPTDTTTTTPAPTPVLVAPNLDMLRQEMLATYIPAEITDDAITEEHEPSPELIDYLNTHTELRDKLNAIQRLHKDNTAVRNQQLAEAIDEYFDNLQKEPEVTPETTPVDTTPVVEEDHRKLYKTYDQTQIYPIQNRSLYDKFTVEETGDRLGSTYTVTDNRKDIPIVKVFDTEEAARNSIRQFVEKAAQYELDKVLRSVPHETLADGLSIKITQGSNKTLNPIQINPYLKQNREQWQLELQYLGNTIGFITNPNLYTFTFDGKVVGTEALTIDQFKKIFNTEGMDAQEALNDFIADYQKAQALGAAIDEYMKGKVSGVLSGKAINDFISIQPSGGQYDFLNADNKQFRPSVSQVMERGNELLAVVDDRTGQDVYGNSENTPEIPEDSRLGNYRAAFQLPNGDTKWVELQTALYTPGELTDITKDIDDYSAKIIAATDANKPLLQKEINDKLATIFISQPPSTGAKFHLRMNTDGHLQIDYYVKEVGSGPSLVVNAGKGKEGKAINFKGDSTQLLGRIEKEINNFFGKVKQQKRGFPTGIKITSGNIRKNFGESPTTEEVMGMQATTSANIMKNYHLEYALKQSSIPVQSIPVANEVTATPEEPTLPEPLEVPEDAENVGGSSIPFQVTDLLDFDKIAGEVETPEQALAAIRKQKQDNANIAKGKANKVLTPSDDFSLQSVVKIDEFKDFILNNLPESITVEDLGTLSDKLISNNFTVGRFITSLEAMKVTGGVIQVYKNSPYKYHEAFHSIFRLLLSQDKINQLLSIATRENPVTQSKLQAFRELHPSYKGLPERELTELYHEEYLADKFDKWMGDRKVPTSHVVKGFFAKILDFIKAIWNKLTGSQIEGMFYDIRRGAYKNAKLQVNSFTDASITQAAMKVIKIGDQVFIDKKGREIVTSRDLGIQQSNQLSSAIAALFVQEVGNSFSYDYNAILDKILNRYRDMMDPERPEYLQRAATLNKPAMVEFMSKLDDLHTVFSSEVGRKSLKESVDQYLRMMDFKQDLADDYIEDITEKTTAGSKNFDAPADAVGGYESLHKDVRLYIGSVTGPYTDEFGNKAFLDASPLIQAVNAGYVYNGLLQNLAGSTDDNELVSKLWAYKDTDGDTGIFIRQLIADTGLTMNEDNSWSITNNAPLFQSFINSFKQFATNPLFAEVDPAKNTTRVYHANRDNSARTQFSQWSNAFTQMYLPGLSTLKEKGDIRKKKEYINNSFEGFNSIKEQIANTEKRAKGITDEALRILAQDASNSLKEQLGISLSPLFIEYSIAKGKDVAVRTDKQKKLVAAYPGVYTIDTEDITGIYNSLLAGDNLFTRAEGEGVREGAASRLIKIASGNAVFDERVWSMSYIGPDGNRRFGYQKGTYNRVTTMKLNNPEYLEELRNNPDKDSYLLQEDNFLAMSEQGKLRVEDISGLKRVVHNIGDTTEEGVELEVSKDLEVNRAEGVAFGDMTEREYHAFSLAGYGADEGKVQYGAGKEDYFYSVPVILRVIAESSTANMVRLPVISAIDKSGNLSQKAIDILYGLIEKEVARIQRVKEEINTLPIHRQLTDYHNGSLRGLKLYDTKEMLGPMAERIEQGANGLDTDGNLLTKLFTMSKAAISGQLNKYWKGQVNNYINRLETTGLISKGNSGITNELLPKFLFDGFGNDVRNEKMNLQKGNFTHNISQVYMNDYLNRMGLIQLLYGDESKAFKGAIDRIRRAKGANGAGDPMAFSVIDRNLGIEHPLIHFHRVLIPEPKYTQHSGAGGDKADAQMYMTTKALRYMLFGFGKLSKIQADILDKIEAGDPIAEKMFIDAGGLNRKVEAFNSYKVVYFDGNVHLKTSAVVLTKRGTSVKINGRWTAKPQSQDLHHLRESMEAFEKESASNGIRTIAYASPMTASKGLNHTVAPSTRTIAADYFHPLNAEDMRLQSETPSNKLTMSDPTGLKFNVLTEQDPGAYAPWLDKNIGQVMKDYLSDSAKRIDNNNFRVINSVFKRTDGTPIRIGDKIGSDITPDMGKLYDYMRQIQEATGTDAQTLAFLETRNGKPVYDLNFPATLQKFTQMVLSYLSKGVNNEKIPGITAALVSDYGHKVIRQVHELTEDGQPKRWTVITDAVYTENPEQYSGYKSYDPNTKLFTGLSEGDYVLDDLKDVYPEYDADGKLLGYFTEVIRPAHYKEEVGGTVVDSLAEMVSTRIPWDDKHQAVVQKVVDILPAYLGSIAITAAPVMGRSGSDDDGDKLFAAIQDTYPTKGQRIPYGTATTDQDKFDEYVRWQLANNKLLRDSISELEDTDEGLIALLLGDRKQILRVALENNKLPSTVEQFMAQGGEGLNNGVLNNRIFNQKVALLSNEHISGGGADAIINQATDTSPIKNLVDPDNSNSLIALLREKGLPDSSPIMQQLLGRNVDINTLLGMGEVFDSAKEGQRDIGAAIISVMTGGFLQQHSISGVGIKFNGKNYDSFGNTTTENGTRKFSSTSAIANTMTDNLKDGGTAGKLGLTINSVGVMGTMVMQGLDLDDVALYTLQPAVSAYFKELKALNGTLLTSAERSKSKSLLLQRLLDTYTKGLDKKELKELESTTLDRDKLLQNIVEGGTDRKLQYAALRDIQTITDEVSTLNDINKVMQMAKGYPASWEDMDNINKSLNNLGIVYDKDTGRYIADSEYKGAIDVRDALLNNHDIYSYYIQKLGQDMELSKKLFLERADLFGRITGIVHANLSIDPRVLPEFNKGLKHDLISYLSIRSYINWLKGRGYDTSTLDHAMIYDSAADRKGPEFENITAIVKRLRSSLKGKKQNFLISKFLRLVETGEEGNRDNINKAESNTWAKLSEHQQQLLQDSFTTLYSNPKTHDDANALFNYLLVKDGGQFKSGSFIKFIPPFAFKDLLDRTTEVTKLLSEEDYSEEKGMAVFGTSYPQILNDFMTSYSTHIGNKFYVPTISNVKVGEQSPVAIDWQNGSVTVDLFRGIRSSAPITGNGITVTNEKGKAYSKEEKELLGKNIESLQASGFAVETVKDPKTGKNSYKIQFPYSLQVGGILYSLRGTERTKGTVTPSMLITTGENMPQGIRAIYKKEGWRGSKAQWKGAGVFGQIPQAIVTPGVHKEVDNPGFSPDSTPAEDKKANIVTESKALPQEIIPQDVSQAQQALETQGIVTKRDSNGRWMFYDDKGKYIASSRADNGPQEYYNHLVGVTGSQLEERLGQLEEAKALQMETNPDIVIAQHMPRITPESARAEVGAGSDINPQMLSKNGVTVQQAAHSIMEDYFHERSGFSQDEQYIRNVIIEILQTGKKNFIDGITRQSEIDNLRNTIRNSKEPVTMNTQQDIVPSQQEEDTDLLNRLASNIGPSEDELEQGLLDCGIE